MITACGIFLIDKDNRVLLGHPTNASWKSWTIPKGKMEEGETYLETAKREFFEESNIDVDKYKGKWYDLGMEMYSTGKKQIYGYAFKIDQTIEEEPVCNSMVDGSNPPFPENDYFKWATFEEVIKLCHHSQVNLIKKYIDEMHEVV